MLKKNLATPFPTELLLGCRKISLNLAQNFHHRIALEQEERKPVSERKKVVPSAGFLIRGFSKHMSQDMGAMITSSDTFPPPMVFPNGFSFTFSPCNCDRHFTTATRSQACLLSQFFLCLSFIFLRFSRICYSQH